MLKVNADKRQRNVAVSCKVAELWKKLPPSQSPLPACFFRRSCDLADKQYQQQQQAQEQQHPKRASVHINRPNFTTMTTVTSAAATIARAAKNACTRVCVLLLFTTRSVELQCSWVLFTALGGGGGALRSRSHIELRCALLDKQLVCQRQPVVLSVECCALLPRGKQWKSHPPYRFSVCMRLQRHAHMHICMCVSAQVFVLIYVCSFVYIRLRKVQSVSLYVGICECVYACHMCASGGNFV